MKPYLEEKEAVLAEAGSGMEGLTDEEAAARLTRDGPNKLREAKKDSLLKKFIGELKDPMTIVLIIAAIVSAVTAVYAHESLTDTAIILAVVLVNACLGVYQESKAEAAIEALQQVAAATAKVIRGGHQKTVRADEVVRGGPADPGSRGRSSGGRADCGMCFHEDPGSRPDRGIHRRGKTERSACGCR